MPRRASGCAARSTTCRPAPAASTRPRLRSADANAPPGERRTVTAGAVSARQPPLPATSVATVAVAAARPGGQSALPRAKSAVTRTRMPVQLAGGVRRHGDAATSRERGQRQEEAESSSQDCASLVGFSCDFRTFPPRPACARRPVPRSHLARRRRSASAAAGGSRWGRIRAVNPPFRRFPHVSHRVTLIPGDGIGPELAEATRRVLEATGVAFDWDVQHAGADVMDQHGGNPLPEHVLDSIRSTKVAIKGPITTPVGSGFRSVNVALRQTLDLYGQVRPSKSYQGVRSRYDDVDLVLIRENTEDLYAGIELEEGEAGDRRGHRDDRPPDRPHHPRRLRPLDQADLRHGDAPHRAVRLRPGAHARPPQGHRRAQGQHHEVHRRPLPARGAGGRRREHRPRVRGPHRGQHGDAARAEARAVRRHGLPEPLRRRAVGPLRRPHRRPRHRAGRQLRHGRGAVRARPRLRAEVRGPEQGEPDGDDAVRRDDAAPPGRARRGRSAWSGDRRRHRRRARTSRTT